MQHSIRHCTHNRRRARPCHARADCILASAWYRVPLPSEALLTLAFLKWSGVPVIMLRLVYYSFKKGIDLTESLDHVELFSGCQSVVNAFLAAGCIAVPYEILHDEVRQLS